MSASLVLETKLPRALKRKTSRHGRRPAHIRVKKSRGELKQTRKDVDVEDLSLKVDEDTKTAQLALLSWYDENHRQLPWRKPPGVMESKWIDFAYAVWVSEIMLQQTQVTTVIDYFEKWMNKWPTIQELAKADLEDVREVWAGLGYYSRATNLWKGAQYVLDHFNGQLPKTVKELERIPGVGAYTSRAIASIAYEIPEAVVDGNVIRVLARLFTIETDAKKHRDVFQKWADQWLYHDRPGDFNQAMMELGATICKPQNPQCMTCPIQSFCKAYQQSTNPSTKDDLSIAKVTDYPKVSKRPTKREETKAVCVLQFADSTSEEEILWTLMIKRPTTGLLAGLWEFPTVSLETTDASSSKKERINNYFKEIANLDIAAQNVLKRSSIGTATHIFSHIRMTLHAELLIIKAKHEEVVMTDNIAHKWIPEKQLASLGMCSMVKKIHDLLTKYKNDS